MGKKYQRHGKSGTNIYGVWTSLKDRCFNKKCKNYKDYGGRGISIQSSWINSFCSFYKYVSSLPNYDESNLGKNGLTIDRINNDGNYEENNLQWASATMQTRNRRMLSNNTTGYKGVHYVKYLKKFLAGISVDKKRINIGYRETAKEAYQLRIDYIKKHKLIGFEVSLD